jgi:hypothetical protein
LAAGLALALGAVPPDRAVDLGGGPVNLVLSAGRMVRSLGRHARWGSGRRLALLLWAVYPNAVLYVPLALTEVFYTTLLSALCWSGGATARPARGFWTVVAGLVLGLATLVKAQSLVVVPLVLPLPVARACALGAVAPHDRAGAGDGRTGALVVLPWTVRNHRELGSWIAVSTNGGITLLTGNNDSARGGFTPKTRWSARSMPAPTCRNRPMTRRPAPGDRLDRAHPAAFSLLMPMKLVRLWGPGRRRAMGL